MKAAPKILCSGLLFLSLYAAWGQQAVAQSVGTADVASTDTTSQSDPEASADDASDDSSSTSTQDVTADSTGDDTSDVEEEIDFGFAVDPGFGVNPNPDSGNAPNIVDGLTSKINDLIENRPTAGWNEVEELEDYCADPAICEPAVFAVGSNQLDFTESDTLLADDSLYTILKDFHNWNTGLLIQGQNVTITNQLQFGGALNNRDGLPTDLVPDDLGVNTAKLGAMLLVAPGNTLDIGKHLGFSKQCTNENNGGGSNPSKQCAAAVEAPGSTVSNDYLGIYGTLEVGSYFHSWGGDDVVYIGSSAKGGRSGSVVVTSEMDLGKGNDQIRMEYGTSLSVGTDLILGEGKDKLVSRGDIVVSGDFDAGDDNDIVEIRGESNVGYGTISVTGKLDLGDGDDTFLLKSPLASSQINKQLFMGNGDDTLDIRLNGTKLLVGSSTIPDDENTHYNLNFGSGKDELINKGNLESGWGIVFGGGDTDDGDFIYNYEGALISTYAGINFTGSGRGTIDNEGRIEVALKNPSGRQIIFGGGDDRIVNRKGGVIDVKGVVKMGEGDDLIVNNGELIATKGIDMGEGNDWFAIAGGASLSLGDGYKVNGGGGTDNLVFSDQETLSAVTAGVDASQQSSSGRRLILASDISQRYENFENAIQYQGSYEYQGDFSSNFDRVFIRDGVMVVRDTAPVAFKNLELEETGTIVVGLSKSDPNSRSARSAPITVTSLDRSGGFTYQAGGKLVISADAQDDPQGTYFVIDGNVNNADELAANTSLVYDCDLDSNADCTEESFGGVGVSNGIKTVFNDIYLQEGSLQLVVEPKDSPVIPDPDPDPANPNRPDPQDPDVNNDGELDDLPGCEVGDDLCDMISDIPGDEDDATDQEEEISDGVIDGITDGLEDNDIDLPLINYGTLAKLIGSGLLPRNVDAPGRSLFNYNNLLVDTVFERLPLRQFSAVEVAEVVEEEAVIVEPQAEEEPIRGLWSKTEGMDEQQVQEYLEQRVAQGDQVVVDDVAIEVDGVGYVEDPSLTSQYAERDGVRAWYRAFGGDIGPTQTSILYGDYSASAGGMVLGADVSLGSNVQIGAFANYGDVTLNQFGGDTGSGSWNPNGWGGGITADYWSENFYVQGLISASSFSGNQKRNIVRITDNLGDETASGEKSATSYAYALRLGAPFQAGSLLMEPQFTAAWTQNQESGFSENGADQLNLRYGSRTTNFLQTELGMKFALPIKSGERAEWVPNLRVAWLGDWDQNNGDQTIGYRFTDKDVDVPSYEKDNNGVLIEGGLDYTMANISSGSWKLFVRGGAEVWGGDRGTDWRASGGVTWQF